MREPLRPFVLAMILVWPLVTAAAAALFGVFNLSRLGEAFDAEARTLHRVISQRADQHDALLTSLAAVAGNAEAADYALVKRVPTGGVAMTIDAQRLVEPDVPLEPGLLLLLAAPDGQPIARIGEEPVRGPLPAFAKELGSRSQLLGLSLRRQPALGEVLPLPALEEAA